MDPKPTQVSLSALAEGAAGELFDREFRRILANMQDPNTAATAKRTIALTLTVTPTEDRERASYSVDVQCKLAGIRPQLGSMYLGEQDGELVAVHFDPRQRDLFREPAADEAVTPINRTRETV